MEPQPIGKQIQLNMAAGTGHTNLNPDPAEAKAGRFASGALAVQELAGILAENPLYYKEDGQIFTVNPGELDNYDQLHLALKVTIDQAVLGLEHRKDAEFWDRYNELIALEYQRTGAALYSGGYPKLLRSAAHTGTFSVLTGLKVAADARPEPGFIDSVLADESTFRTLTHPSVYHMEIFSEVDSVLRKQTKGRYWDTRFFVLNGTEITLNHAAFTALKDYASAQVSPDTPAAGCAALYAKVQSDSNPTVNVIKFVYNWTRPIVSAWATANPQALSRI